ncbi:acetyltransferase domain-containing protein [Xylaria palmicola]|nr:acetyltransferase domain-containing protein [Xylaria palmicola]
MKVNEGIAVSTSKILLVPYDAHHVERYHKWMQDEALREATASDLLTLEEECENQQSWRSAHDKLTFIVCQPAAPPAAPAASPSVTDGGAPAMVVVAGDDDAPPRMVGDVNLFLTPCDDDDDDDDDDADGEDAREGSAREVKGEVDIMIAAPEHRRRGLGEAAVRAFLRFLAGRHGDVMREYARGAGDARLRRLVAKINADNAGSIRLFENLGFRRDGGPDYFNEISMVLADFSPPASTAAAAASETGVAGAEDGVLGYRECLYDRSRLKTGEM